MEIVSRFFADYPWLALAQTAFMIWMLVDAYRRGAEFFWYWIILFLQPFVGAAIYFFAVKIHDFTGARQGFSLSGLFQRRASLDELTYRAEQTPTLTNHLALAERLREVGRAADAVPHVEAALKSEPDHGAGLYLLARCRVALGQLDEATRVLERLVGRDPRWSNYAALQLLVEVRAKAGDAAGAVAHARELARLSPTLQFQCLLAERLLDANQDDEARGVLERALRDHDFAQAPIRRRNSRWARHARGLLRQAGG